MSEQIKRAIELIKSHIKANNQSLANGFEYTPKDEILQQNEEYCVILECLKSELDRQENKALTLSELKDMVGEPVWVVPKDYMVNVPIKAIVIMTVFEDENNSINNYVRSDNGNIFYIEHNIFCEHEPTEGGEIEC